MCLTVQGRITTPYSLESTPNLIKTDKDNPVEGSTQLRILLGSTGLKGTVLGELRWVVLKSILRTVSKVIGVFGYTVTLPPFVFIINFLGWGVDSPFYELRITIMFDRWWVER